MRIIIDIDETTGSVSLVQENDTASALGEQLLCQYLRELLGKPYSDDWSNRLLEIAGS